MMKGRTFDRRLMHVASRLHYLDGLSQREVAVKLDISTASVSRLLARAREEGIVQIQVADIFDTDFLGAELRSTLSLGAASVCDVPRPHDLAFSVGKLLRDGTLANSPVVAIGWGRTVQTVITEGLPMLQGSCLVPSIGGMEDVASHFQINEFVRLAARSAGGHPLFLHAPSMASPELRDVLARDEKTRRVFECWERVDAAVLGIGAIGEASYAETLQFGEANRSRVVGDVARRYFDALGRDVVWDGESELLAISRRQMRRVPLSIGVATGLGKAYAILGAVRSGMINALVTDSATATEVLSIASSD